MTANSLNTLIAGVIGSGKSYLENLMINAIIKSGADCWLVLIDPKRVELAEYETDPRTLYYADDEDGIYDALCSVYEMMETRYEAMKAARQKATTEKQVFVFVDEMAFLMQSDRKREYVNMFNKITLLGRAAGIHLILCTQVATQDVIPACIRDNMTNIVCLRQRDAGKYRYLLGDTVAALPRIGYAYLKTPDSRRIERLSVDRIWSKLAGEEA